MPAALTERADVESSRAQSIGSSLQTSVTGERGGEGTSQVLDMTRCRGGEIRGCGQQAARSACESFTRIRHSLTWLPHCTHLREGEAA